MQLRESVRVSNVMGRLLSVYLTYTFIYNIHISFTIHIIFRQIVQEKGRGAGDRESLTGIGGKKRVANKRRIGRGGPRERERNAT